MTDKGVFEPILIMLTIKNDHLNVSLLDPQADTHLLGSRYCHGGYIWQIEDNVLGPLLSGPKYPDIPDPFDGQGMPEAFETALSYFPTSIGDTILIIGVGEVIRTSDIEPFHSRYNPQIKKPCSWIIQSEPDCVLMKTDQFFKGYSFTLLKRVSLSGRTVQSFTEVVNSGPNPIPLKWFAHPFFPLTFDRSCCKLSLPVSIPPNPGFALSSESYICMDNNYNWESGCYRSLEIPWNKHLNVTVKHPLLNQISMDCKFNPTWLPIWANSKTFSVEPFFFKMSVPGSSTTWAIEYHF
jgi:hypothetical protein